MKPTLATLIDAPFDSPDWIFEVKFDGYRALAHIDKAVKLLSRNGKLFNDQFPTLVKELAKLPSNCVVDGEIVILDQKGRSHFQLLQNYKRTQKGTPYFYLFDLLVFEGKDIRHLPLMQRRELLKKHLKKLPHVRFSESIDAHGIAFFKKAEKKGLEGIIGKLKTSIYPSRRTLEWVKIKAQKGQEMVIGGFTKPAGSRKYFGALLLGVYEKGKLRYCGRVGTGFDRALLKEVYAEMKPLITKKCPFATEVEEEAIWIKPTLVCEVSFTEWTNAGSLRHPVFKGLRTDKSAKKVVRE